MSDWTDGPPFAFGELLRHHRLAARLTQETLAERCRLSPPAISALERGVRRRPYRGIVDRLANALGLSPAQREQLAAAAPPRRRPAGWRAPAGPSEPGLPAPPTPPVGRVGELRLARDARQAGGAPSHHRPCRCATRSTTRWRNGPPVESP